MSASLVQVLEIHCVRRLVSLTRCSRGLSLPDMTKSMFADTVHCLPPVVGHRDLGDTISEWITLGGVRVGKLRSHG